MYVEKKHRAIMESGNKDFIQMEHQHLVGDIKLMKLQVWYMEYMNIMNIQNQKNS